MNDREMETEEEAREAHVCLDFYLSVEDSN